jgi:hypothetical protein
MKTVAFANSGSDIIRVLICLRIVGKAFTVRSGLITRNTRTALKLTSKEKSSTILYK